MLPVLDPGEACPVVTHGRDLIVLDGALEQDYHFLQYDFGAGDFIGRAYLHDLSTVLLMRKENFARIRIEEVPQPILAYLQYRFDEIDVFGDAEQETLWARRAAQ